MDGLEEGSVSVLSMIETGPFFAYKGTSSHIEAFPAPEGLEGDFALGRLREADLQAGNTTLPVRVFSLSAVNMVTEDGPSSREAFLSSSTASGLGIDPGTTFSMVKGERKLEFVFGDYLRTHFTLPQSWVLISEEDMKDLFPDVLATYSFVLLDQRNDAFRLQGGGFTVMSLASAGDFFYLGLEEARRIVIGIVVASSVAIAIIAFSLLSLEVRYRRSEMETLRAIGMDARGFAKLYGLQMAFILVSGSFIGLAMGIVVANGLVSFSPFFGLSTIIRPQVTATGILLPLLSSLAAGLLGGSITILTSVRRLSHEA